MGWFSKESKENNTYKAEADNIREGRSSKSQEFLEVLEYFRVNPKDIDDGDLRYLFESWLFNKDSLEDNLERLGYID